MFVSKQDFEFFFIPNFPISLPSASMSPVVASTNSSAVNFSHLSRTVHQLQLCMSSLSGRYVILSFAITSCLLVLPFCLWVLFQGLRRWREQRSNTVTSNFHLFAYHLAVIEIMGIVGHIVFFCGAATDVSILMAVGVVFFLFTSAGQMFFHFLASVERYLAVLHPITYRALRKAKANRIRIASMSFAWIVSFAAPFFTFVNSPAPVMFMASVVVLYFIAFLFLSFSVVFALTTERFGPKLRAFHILLVILGVLFVRFSGHLVLVVFVFFSFLGRSGLCSFILSELWFGLPSSLVLPLLYLNKAGKLHCCKK